MAQNSKQAVGGPATTGAAKAKMEGSLAAEAGQNEVGLTIERDGIEFSLTLPRKQAKQFANDILDAAKASKS